MYVCVNGKREWYVFLGGNNIENIIASCSFPSGNVGFKFPVLFTREHSCRVI
jgi:hypothetical protein